jgi:curved DNA-binding protein CbpA
LGFKGGVQMERISSQQWASHTGDGISNPPPDGEHHREFFSTDPTLEKKPNHYQVLNLEPHASRLEIREAYLRLKSAYDHGSAALYSLIPDDEAQVLLEEMEIAFQVLNDDAARRNYDISLGLGAPATSQQNHEAERKNQIHSERLMYAQESLRAERLASFGTRFPERDEFQARNDSHYGAMGRDMAPMTVQTSRSQLPVVKLKAEKCEDESVASQMNGLLETADLADGDLYKRLRELAGVSQDEMQDRTKISIGYLLAIESNRLDRLPQSVYVKGFLRSYFRYIGAPRAEEMVNAFSTRLAQWQAKNRS